MWAHLASQAGATSSAVESSWWSGTNSWLIQQGGVSWSLQRTTPGFGLAIIAADSSGKESGATDNGRVRGVENASVACGTGTAEVTVATLLLSASSIQETKSLLYGSAAPCWLLASNPFDSSFEYCLACNPILITVGFSDFSRWDSSRTTCPCISSSFLRRIRGLYPSHAFPGASGFCCGNHTRYSKNVYIQARHDICKNGSSFQCHPSSLLFPVRIADIKNHVLLCSHSWLVFPCLSYIKKILNTHKHTFDNHHQEHHWHVRPNPYMEIFLLCLAFFKSDFGLFWGDEPT